MKTLLLTGWTWYIWSHTALLLLENGYDLILFDNLSNSDKNIRKKIENITKKKVKFYKWDLRKKEDIQKVFSENSIDTVLHFSGAKSVGESCEKPFYYYENNIIASLNLFESMNDFWVKNIIFSSSANVYWTQTLPPFSEKDSAWDTSNPYGTSKFIIERLLRDLHFQKKFNVINLRYFNPIGAHRSGLIWEHANQKLWNILPFLLRVANAEQEKIEIYGNNYDTPDGTGVRDYIHVMDLAAGHVKAYEYIQKQEKNILETINLGTGKWTSVLELIHIVEEVTQRKILYSYSSRRDIDIASAYCSTKKAEELLWWKAQKSVKEAIKDSWNFIQKTQWK